MKTDSVYNPVLSFVFREIKAVNKYDEIVAKTVQYFKAGMLTKAKDELLQLVAVSTRSTDRVEPQDMVVDLTRAIRTCDENKVVLPKFEIYESDEVRVLSGEVTATLTRHINELLSTVDDVIDNLSFFRLVKNLGYCDCRYKCNKPPRYGTTFLFCDSQTTSERNQNAQQSQGVS